MIPGSAAWAPSPSTALLALLVTAKSIARFEELKERRFAEYYLAGILASLLVALTLGFALKEGLFPLLRQGTVAG